MNSKIIDIVIIFSVRTLSLLGSGLVLFMYLGLIYKKEFLKEF